MSFKISGVFNVPMKVLIPTIDNPKGQTQKTYPNPDTLSDEFLIFGNFRTFGGTEKIVNNVLTIENTATVQTYFRPDIKSGCALYLLEKKVAYEIMGDPEDIELKHQFLQIRVKKLKGGV